MTVRKEEGTTSLNWWIENKPDWVPQPGKRANRFWHKTFHIYYGLCGIGIRGISEEDACDLAVARIAAGLKDSELKLVFDGTRLILAADIENQKARREHGESDTSDYPLTRFTRRVLINLEQIAEAKGVKLYTEDSGYNLPELE